MIGLLFYLKNSDDFLFHNIQLIILYIHKLILFQLLVFFNALKYIMKTIWILMKVSVSVKYFLIFYILNLSKIERTMLI